VTIRDAELSNDYLFRGVQDVQRSKDRWMADMRAMSINVRVSDEARLRQLDALAEATGRSRDLLINEALQRYLDDENGQLAKIEEGLRQADAGEFYTTEEVTAGVRAIIAAARERKAVQDAQKPTA
jgi:RHH-type transcriptional regulator, rel operon repressor / antitoxin RelB